MKAPPTPSATRRTARLLARLLVLSSVVGSSACTSCSGDAPPSAAAASPSASSAARDPALAARLAEALASKGKDYVPRTRHKNADGSPRFTNRLILEKSPYLLQHAHNPVDWFPWGDEAFERAKALGKPVFLSIGYSTCHWCHVMEEESFEDEEIAAYLNEHYVAIKVDREERPDIDAVYMTFVQSLTGNGGWPMNTWLTPDRKPFFGGTYFPPRAGVRGARAGLLDTLQELSTHYTADPAAAAAEAGTMTARLRESIKPSAAGALSGVATVDRARALAAQRFDPAQGGARGAPKFPSGFPVRALLHEGARSADAGATAMALTTLRHMRAGGIYDHVGGGFHRYATDGRWLVPHFEKMLYDNAQLATAYLEGFQASRDPSLEATVRATLDYLLRDMRSPDGTFYAATDADSPGPNGKREEGLFFTWTPAELGAVLGADDAAIAARTWSVPGDASVEGRSILYEQTGAGPSDREKSVAPDARLEGIRARLFEARSRRPPPLRDDKVVVSWNALTVSALARAAIVLGDERYGRAAVEAATRLVAETRAGRPLPHQLVDGRPLGAGFGDDYALLAAALLDVFELTADAAWLEDAIGLMNELQRSFVDETNGGYFLSATTHEALLVRDKPADDGPIPSPSSAAAVVWVRLYAMTGDDDDRKRAEATIRAFASTLEERPLSLDHMLLAIDEATDAQREVVIVVPEGGGALTASARPMLDVLGRAFVPNVSLVVAEPSRLEALSKKVSWAKDRPLKGGKATAYLCVGQTCKLPTNDPAVFETELRESMQTKLP